jgi:hypothetical protein
LKELKHIEAFGRRNANILILDNSEIWYEIPLKRNINDLFMKIWKKFGGSNTLGRKCV